MVAGPVLGRRPGDDLELTTGSVIPARVTNESRAVGLSPPNTLQALRRLVGEDGFPQVFTQFGPARTPGAPRWPTP